VPAIVDMAAFIAPGLVLLALLMVLRLAIGGRVSAFSPNRARMASRNLHGSNAALMLSAAALAGLALSISTQADRWEGVQEELGPVLAAGLVVALVALVAFRSADTVLGVIGFGAETISAGLEHGAPGAISVVVLATLLIMILGFLRGFVRPA
jgi:hypothetical protein